MVAEVFFETCANVSVISTDYKQVHIASEMSKDRKESFSSLTFMQTIYNDKNTSKLLSNFTYQVTKSKERSINEAIEEGKGSISFLSR